MKSAHKKQKILNIKHLIQVIKEKDEQLIIIGSELDKAHDRINRMNKHMMDLTKFMKMENVDQLSLLDVITEVKKRLGE